MPDVLYDLGRKYVVIPGIWTSKPTLRSKLPDSCLTQIGYDLLYCFKTIVSEDVWIYKQDTLNQSMWTLCMSEISSLQLYQSLVN